MVHRRLNPSHYHPESYEDIVIALTPEPEDNMPTQDFHKSPYLTYLRPRAKVDVKLDNDKGVLRWTKVAESKFGRNLDNGGTTG